MARSRFVTAVNCMDGRVQEPVIRWMTRRLAADYVDMITEAGPVGALATGSKPEVQSIRKRLDVSVRVHGSRVIAVVAHADCAGNPVPDEDQKGQVRRASALLKSWHSDVRVVGLWVGPRGVMEVLCDTENAFV